MTLDDIKADLAQSLYGEISYAGRVVAAPLHRLSKAELMRLDFSGADLTGSRLSNLMTYDACVFRYDENTVFHPEIDQTNLEVAEKKRGFKLKLGSSRGQSM